MTNRTVVILPGADRGLRDLLEELGAAAGDTARADVTTGHGGVVTTEEIALRWLAARLGYELPAAAPPRPAPTPPKVRPRKTTTKTKAKATRSIGARGGQK